MPLQLFVWQQLDLDWIFCIYNLITRPDSDKAQETVTTEMDVNALNDYLAGLSAEEARIKQKG